MMESGFALFDTAIGSCAIAWGERGVLGVQLPEADATRTRARMRRRFPSARETSPPAEVQQTIDGIVALINGEAVDFSAVPLDLEQLPAFPRRVYEVVRTIPCGATLTYGEIAKRLGVPAEARDVGEAMARNPFPILVPLDLEQLPAFPRRVYEVVRTIPCGATLTYGEIAKRLGVPAEARDVGEAM